LQLPALVRYGDLDYIKKNKIKSNNMPDKGGMYILQQSNGVAGLGHTGMMIYNGSDWIYYSAESKNSMQNPKWHFGASDDNVTAPLGDTITKAKNNSTIEKYDIAIHLTTTLDENKRMINSLDKKNNFKNYENKYNVVTSNCKDLVGDQLQKVGIKTYPSMPMNQIPNRWFVNISKQNNTKIYDLD
jgi:hypothetical protein